MNIFIDTANLQDIEEALKRGFVRGVTTNPSLLAKEPKAKFEQHIGKIIALIEKHQPGISLSVEVFSKDPDTILEQAKQFIQIFQYPEISIKVHVGWNELELIRVLSAEGIKVNCTCVMNVSQAVMAASSGAHFVSIFWGRIRDGGGEKYAGIRKQYIEEGRLTEMDFDPSHVVRETRKIFDTSYPNSRIIVGSLRSVNDFIEAASSGAHIVTVPPKYFPGMIEHYKTDEVVNQFLQDFASWIQ